MSEVRSVENVDTPYLIPECKLQIASPMYMRSAALCLLNKAQPLPSRSYLEFVAEQLQMAADELDQLRAEGEV